MQKPGDELLVAYLDGELDGARREEVERWLDRDPAARERVALLGESTALIKAAFDEGLREPVPGRLIAAARGETSLGTEGPAGGNVVSFRAKAKPPLHRRWWVTVPAAASLFGLVVGAGAGYWGLGGTTRAPEVQTASATSPTGAWLDNARVYHDMWTSTAAGEGVFVDVPPNNDQGEVTTKVSQRLGQPLPKIPDLKPWGLSFKGVRYLAIEGRTAAQLFYSTENKAIGPLTVVVAQSARPDIAPTFVHRDDVNMLYWRRGGRAYALVGQIDKGWLWGLANDIGWQLNAI
jgi:anti-sigma factor RsiW